MIVAIVEVRRNEQQCRPHAILCHLRYFSLAGWNQATDDDVTSVTAPLGELTELTSKCEGSENASRIVGIALKGIKTG